MTELQEEEKKRRKKRWKCPVIIYPPRPYFNALPPHQFRHAKNGMELTEENKIFVRRMSSPTHTR